MCVSVCVRACVRVSDRATCYISGRGRGRRKGRARVDWMWAALSPHGRRPFCPLSAGGGRPHERMSCWGILPPGTAGSGPSVSRLPLHWHPPSTKAPRPVLDLVCGAPWWHPSTAPRGPECHCSVTSPGK